jgi:hypothetical protein
MSRVSFQLAFLAILLVPVTYAQNTSHDVVVSGASLNDPYGVTAMCGADGQVYRWTSGHPNQPNALMRVGRDGSSVLFMLPESARPEVIAATSDSLYVLSYHLWKGEGRAYDLYQYDSRGNLLSENLVHTDFELTRMAALSSGAIIATTLLGKDDEDWKYGGAVLNAGGQVMKTFELPLPLAGGGWTYTSPLAAEGDTAYIMLHANFENKTAIATISETGRVEIKVISVPAGSEQRHHNQWLFGRGVAVDWYVDHSERPHVSSRFDEYDLATGAKIATKKAAPGAGGYNIGCYYGDEVTWLAGSAHVDPARGLSPDTVRLVTTEIR